MYEKCIIEAKVTRNQHQKRRYGVSNDQERMTEKILWRINKQGLAVCRAKLSAFVDILENPNKRTKIRQKYTPPNQFVS